MSVKSFKFVSPGVFINEIDNSFIPRSSEEIGPVVIGRATRGLGLQPIKVQSYSKFVEIFGDTVPGLQGGDVSRNGNFTSPMYGTYASKAFLASNVAPLTYIRLLGAEHPNATTTGKAGWQTTDNLTSGISTNGGAYGLWLFPSSSADTSPEDAGTQITGTLAAIFYADDAAAIFASGTYWLPASGTTETTGIGKIVQSDSNNLVSILVTSSGGTYDETIKFNFDDDSDSYIRSKFNTNPTIASAKGEYYNESAYRPYWLGETFDQDVRDAGLNSGAPLAAVWPICLSGSTGTGPHRRRVASQEARTSWFIGQDLVGQRSDFRASTDTQKLFRLIGRGHGEWLQKNCKVSVEKIRQSTSTTTDYGTFSIVIRQLQDTDNRVVVLERFDNLSLDPGSPNYIARAIGDTYHEWDNQARQLKSRGSYPNQSKYVYVDMDTTVAAGASKARNLPFGYFGPPRYSQVKIISTGADSGTASVTPADAMINWESSLVGASTLPVLKSAASGTNVVLTWPSARIRHSGSDGGMSDQKNAYYGFMNTRTTTSTRHDASMSDVHAMLDSRYVQSVDPTATEISGADKFAYCFTLNDIRAQGSGSNSMYYYSSGSYQAGTSVTATSYETLLNARVNRFTAPFYGGFDGFNVKLPDPLSNKELNGKTETNSSAYFTVKRAIDTVADPESVDMNLITMPGLTNNSLTTHMLNVSEDRADTMALIDLPSVYTPPHEGYNATFAARLGAGAESTANALKNRRLDTSYGATFYPWVQTLDEATQRLVWIPPSVAMMGVLASSQASSHLWFAPAGFNRGGLSDGAAGIPITNVTERLTSKDRDVLYDAKINPIASFPSTGLVVFGQKTLQERQSALDRINVRRLVIYLKKQISILSTQVLFEQNVPTTWNRFKSLVEPFLANVKVQFGITDYRLLLDESTTTPDLVDQNIMYAKIMIKPARAIEYIAIDFVVASTGASFDD